MSRLINYFVQLIFFGAMLVQLANAIQCYNCDSNTNKDCHKITKSSSVKPVDCRPNVIRQNTPEWLSEIINIDFFETTPDVTVPMVCQKIVALNEKNEKHTFRGCQLNGGKSDICDITMNKAAVAENGITIESCDLCEGDACNKSIKMLVDLRLVAVLLTLMKLIL